MSLAAAETVSVEVPRRGWLSWAAFLGMSWTWCIGMFLPVMLVRDYGISGWIVFAVPNVLGAAAMGWVIRSRQSSERIAQTHRLAATLFSGVTIAFHLFFVIAVIAPLAQSVLPPQEDSISTSEAIDLAAGGMFVASVLLYIYLTRRPDADHTLSWIVLAISVGAIVCTMPDLLGPSLGMSRMTPLDGSSMSDLIWLAPLCVFGFLCCPYLDLTFHRAHQSSESSRASFGVGFVGIFLPMIVFTLLYARAMSGGLMTQWIAAFLYVHLAVQSAFTVAVHARELKRNARAAVIIAGILTVVSVLAYWGIRLMPFQSPLRIGEVIYRSFMGFYGLVFPAYVWLAMLPGRGRVAPTRRTLIVYALAVLVALPMFAQGFLLQNTVWLAPGLGLVLVARLFIRAQRGPWIQRDNLCNLFGAGGCVGVGVPIMSRNSMSRMRKLWRTSLRPLAALILLLTSFRSAIADWNDVPSGSMRPTIIEGDRIFVNKLAYGLKIPFTTIYLARWNAPQRGEIVVFFSPEEHIRMVKRVVGLPGDVIEMVNNHLFIKGEPVQYLAQNGQVMEHIGKVTHAVTSIPQIMAMRSFGPLKVPAGQYFMMGDNRDNSRDSRYYGTVPEDQITGRSSRVILSLDCDEYYLPRWGRFFTNIANEP